MEIREVKSDEHYIYNCGQESFRRSGVAHIAKKKKKRRSTWVQSQKQQIDLGSLPRQMI